MIKNQTAVVIHSFQIESNEHGDVEVIIKGVEGAGDALRAVARAGIELGPVIEEVTAVEDDLAVVQDQLPGPLPRRKIPVGVRYHADFHERTSAV